MKSSAALLVPVLALLPLSLRAQSDAAATSILLGQVCVQDASGRAITAAQVISPGIGLNAVTDNTGCARIPLVAPPGTTVRILHPGFATMERPLGFAGTGTINITLLPATLQETIQVTAARTPLALDASASSVRILTAQQLHEAPSFTLDDALRQVAGFQLFRRTSSSVANPTTEGIALRGLGSTAASRTLFLDDQIPINDAFGGWIHWNEIPSLAIQQVELMRGGASDLYGSSAIGGVIETITARPRPSSYALDLAGATQATSSLNGIASTTHGPWGVLGATSLFRTGGYILIAPPFRGAVDIPSNVHSQSGRLELRRSFASDGSAFLRGNLLNEARSNGTVAQTNGTRIWRYTAGADWTQNPVGHLLLRAYGNDQGYRQSFSTITPTRSSEKLSRFQRVPSQQFGGVAQWARSVHTFTFIVGSDLLDTRGADAETSVSATTGLPGATTSISARQRAVGGYGEVLWNSGAWSAALSGRVDSFRSFDGHTALGAARPTTLPNISENVFDPRLGLVRQLPGGLSLTASVFRAFRGPTLNELYRTGQVGQQITQANPNLRSERATGFELGGLLQQSHASSLRASYFWTQVNRPVAALTISSTPTTLTQMRQNLGQLESRGVTAEWDFRPIPSIQVTGGYQFALSTVTKFQPDRALVGKWTPQVPRNSATAQIRYSRPRFGVVSLDLRNSGRQYDDSANSFQLHSYFLANIYVEHAIRENLRLYATVQNLLDRQIEAGRTPILTLGTPRTILVGIRLH